METNEQILAEKLHFRLCKLNHADECDWYYQLDWTKHNWSHKRYLKKAQNILAQVNFDDALKVVELL